MDASEVTRRARNRTLFFNNLVRKLKQQNGAVRFEPYQGSSPAFTSGTEYNSYVTNIQNGPTEFTQAELTELLGIATNIAVPTAPPAPTPPEEPITGGVAQWAANTTASSNSIEFVSAICDNSGYVYVLGYSTSNSLVINNYVSVGEGEIQVEEFAHFPYINNNYVFLIKYDSSGTAVWATNSYITNIEFGYTSFNNCLCIDNLNNIYLSLNSSFNNTIIINSYDSIGEGEIQVTQFGTVSVTSGNSCIIQYNPNGQVQWVVKTDCQVNSIACDSSNNIYIYGLISTSNPSIYSFGSTGTPIVFTTFGTLPTNEASGTFIIKYNSTGQAQWATKLNDSSNIVNRSLFLTCTNDGCIYLTGVSNKTNITAYNYNSVSSGTINLDQSNSLSSSTGQSLIFLFKYTSSGQAVWGTVVGESESNDIYIRSIINDSSNNIYVLVESYSSTIYLYNYNTISDNQFTTSLYAQLARKSIENDNYIIKYSPSGIVQWATIYYSPTEYVQARSIVIDSIGLYCAGSYNGIINIESFVSHSGTTITTIFARSLLYSNTGARNDWYIIKYTLNGIAKWGTSISDDNANILKDIAVTNDGYIYAVGTYQSIAAQVLSFDSVANTVITQTVFGTMPNNSTNSRYGLIAKFTTI